MNKIPLMADHDPVALLPDSEEDEAKIVKSRRLILLLAVMLLVGGVWAWFAVLDEVSTGTGKVIPSSREQVIQTLDGGILTELNVREGSKVQAGQVVARLDPTRSESNVGESQAKYRASREQLSKANADVASLAEVIKGRADSVTRLTVRSPVQGIVKNIKVNTIGGVIAPNGELMEIVPVDGRLLIEARISPRDIAFIHPDQQALVKITAYDYAIYGALNGVVETISPDTTQDEAKPDVYYYRVFIRTDYDYLENKSGKRFLIGPGMIATVDIKTGEKTVMDYLVKPFNRAKEALRER